MDRTARDRNQIDSNGLVSRVKTRLLWNAKPSEAPAHDWNLCLYIDGPTPKSVAAFRNLEQICEKHLTGRYYIEVIDLTKNPKIARDDQIVAVPTVVRKRSSPIRKIIGDLSNTQRVLAGLDLRPHNPKVGGSNPSPAIPNQ
jgi:circadian clock protein KaiB